eukprot:1141800-Pelagomonas_calceolata.AAC.2
MQRDALQSYNTLLTLSHLHCVSDGIITLENDALHRCCTRLMQIPRPSFAVGGRVEVGRWECNREKERGSVLALKGQDAGCWLTQALKSLKYLHL